MRLPLILALLGAVAATCGEPARACCGDLLDAGTFARPVAPSSAAAGIERQAASLGLHAVTTVYTATSVITRGDTTTYSALTEERRAGTFARLVASAGTGELTPYDSLSSNPRLGLSDGRRVAGDYYANFVVRAGAIEFDRFVFFADDAETLRRPGPTPPPAPSARPAATAPPAATTPPPPLATAAPAGPGPGTGNGEGARDGTGLPSPRPSAAGRATPAPTRPGREVRAGIALAPQADPLQRAEVLRGRRTELWVRATVDGRPARVRSWRLDSGEITVLGPVSGRGDGPLVGMWPTFPPRGSTYTVRIEATVEVPGAGARRAWATIDVAIRSPAIVE